MKKYGQEPGDLSSYKSVFSPVKGAGWGETSPRLLLSPSNCCGIDSTPRALRSSPYSNFYSCCKVKNKRGWNLYGSFEFWRVMTKSYKAWAHRNDWEKFSEGWFQEKPFVFLWVFFYEYSLGNTGFIPYRDTYFSMKWLSPQWTVWINPNNFIV